MKEVVQIAALFKRKLSSWKNSPRKTIIAYLDWHAIRGQIAYVKKGERIIAAAVGRGVHSIEAARQDPYHFYDNAEIVYCDYHVSDKTIYKLLVALKYRFPFVKKIAFNRPKGEGRLRVYDFKRFMELTRRVA